MTNLSIPESAATPEPPNAVAQAAAHEPSVVESRLPSTEHVSTTGRAGDGSESATYFHRGVMQQDAPRQALSTASVPTLDRVRMDRDQVPNKLKPLLAYIEAHLFDPGLSVNRLKRDCGVRDNSVAIHFHACVGQPPHAYISQCRMEIAARLLHDSELPVWKISELLGFSSIQVFSRAFYRWAQQRPSTYRRRHRPVERAADGSLLPPRTVRVTADEPTSDGTGLEDFWHRALDGRLHDAEAADLIRRLLELYPPHRRFRP